MPLAGGGGLSSLLGAGGYARRMSDTPEVEPPEPEGVGELASIDAWLAYSPERKPEPKPRRRVNWLLIASAVIAVAVVAAMVVLRPNGEARQRAERQLSALGVPSIFYGARVASVDEHTCDYDSTQNCVTVEFAIEQGPDTGATYSQEFQPGGTTPSFFVGEGVVLSYQPANGVVTDMTPTACSFDPTSDCLVLSVQITEGDVAGSIVTTETDDTLDYIVGLPVQTTFYQTEGDITEVLDVSPVSTQTQYLFSDFQRRSVLLWTTVLFALAVIALGRWRGLAALAGLGMSLMVLLVYVLPAILDGRSPVGVAIVGSAAIAYLALYLAHGVNPMTTTALFGTLGALVITALLSTVVVAVAHFTGFASEESSLLTLFPNVDVRGLLLAGMVLGAAGALDDVTVTQASAVWELRHASPDMTAHDLFVRGSRIGRDHIASTVNTLLLAYAGASLPLMILLVLSQQSLGSVANSEVVAVEIVRTLVGSIGLVAAVPITTWLAARAAISTQVATPEPEPAPE
jgi:uncharacterized membrane protein